jgi:hypothetical protein
MSGVLSGAATPIELIPGDPDQVDALALEYARYAGGASDAVALLKRIASGEWIGPAGDAFRQAMGELPDKLSTGVTAMNAASHALTAYASALRAAQRQAAQAISQYADGDRSSAVWQHQVSAHQQSRAAAHQLAHATGTPVPPDTDPPSSSDPGSADRAAATQTLGSARGTVEAAAAVASHALNAASQGAPHKPGLLSRALHDVGHFFQGAGESTWSMLKTGVEMSPTYAMMNPLGFLHNAENMGKGLLNGVEHPVQFGKALLDWDEWSKDPSKAAGDLLPTVLLTLFSGGAGAAAKGEDAATVADRLALTADAGASRTPWLVRIRAGTAFNRLRWSEYSYNELRLASGKVLDSYDPFDKIVSRKFTQLAKISPKTAQRYIDEIKQKYPINARIGTTPSVPPELRGGALQGKLVLEVPLQHAPIPPEILRYAKDRNVLIEQAPILDPGSRVPGAAAGAAGGAAVGSVPRVTIPSVPSVPGAGGHPTSTGGH